MSHKVRYKIFKLRFAPDPGCKEFRLSWHAVFQGNMMKILRYFFSARVKWMSQAFWTRGAHAFYHAICSAWRPKSACLEHVIKNPSLRSFPTIMNMIKFNKYEQEQSRWRSWRCARGCRRWRARPRPRCRTRTPCRRRSRRTDPIRQVWTRTCSKALGPLFGGTTIHNGACMTVCVVEFLWMKLGRVPYSVTRSCQYLIILRTF